MIDDDGKTQYSSSENTERDVPWNEQYTMDGKEWTLDVAPEGKKHDSPLAFEGMDASLCPAYDHFRTQEACEKPRSRQGIPSAVVPR